MTTNAPNPATKEPPTGEGLRSELVVSVNYEIFIFGLTIVQFLNSILLFTLENQDAYHLVRGFFIAIAVVLIFDLFNRVRRMREVTGRRMAYAWLNLIGSIPAPFFVTARLVRTWLVTRRMSSSEVDDAQQVIIRQRAGGLLLLAILAATIVLEFGGLLMLYVESASPEANIHTASDAIWWGLVTVATVGYGDKYPVTNEGRLVGVLVMIVGVGLFSLLTSFLAKNFIDNESAGLQPLQQVTGEAETELQAIRRLLDEYEGHHQATMGELRARLEMLEGQDGPEKAPTPDGMPRKERL